MAAFYVEAELFGGRTEDLTSDEAWDQESTVALTSRGEILAGRILAKA